MSARPVRKNEIAIVNFEAQLFNFTFCEQCEELLTGVKEYYTHNEHFPMKFTDHIALSLGEVFADGRTIKLERNY